METVSFGFREVERTQKQPLVREVFDSVASRYDLMNDVMSAGVHRLWKAELIGMIRPRPGSHLLDVAGGTGDIAFRYLDAAGETAHVTLADINESMVRVGRNRALDRGYLHGLDFVVGNAECLPVPSRSVDVYTIAFGLRNVTDIDAALREAHRVLKPGGRYFCLEFSHVDLPGLAQVYDAYSFHLLPWLGQVIAQDRASYRYLVESIRKFPPQDALVERMEQAGFRRVHYRNLSGGIAAIHSGWRL